MTDVNLEQRLGDIATNLQRFVESHSGQAWDVLLAATRMDGVSALVGGLVAASFSLGLLRLTRHFAKKAKDGEELWFGAAVFTGIGAFIATVIAALCIFDPWTWTAIFAPELYLAHKVIG